ncbi:thymidylate synthase, flavin-dependent [candidate division WWE3 bacterium RBG_16_52_45]|nr:MAG: thymidylate synthase, flavin-dependent [candidate division WWE3 bacterium RBG_16_52_45]
MHKVEPKVFLVGETRVVEEGLQAYLIHLGVPDWQTDSPSDAEKLIEVMGRLCYRSFEPGLNPNVTKVREGSASYLGNILKTAHGSVIEHPMMNFIFADVSRVFTHELVRHRAGVAISQESLRFVRLENLGQWLPTVIREDQEATEIFVRTFEQLEKLQVELAKHFKLDEPGVPFHFKKVVTSAMRRIAPDGLATTIGWSANPRALRWVLEMRTDPSAEEEIRLVFGKVGEIVVARYPNLFGDFTVEVVDGLPCYRPASRKV